ncbi:MAG: aminotransferase class V-fold PLP-dependent enzyme [Firmicutes bacterium]|nr:aminotransferase class V-fold PLP-dependent enzyme [Bacillota bacterium]
MYSLIDFLPEHAGQRPVSFHMPGHKGADFYDRMGYGQLMEKLVDMDITEIPGADNLFQNEDVILEVMEKYRKLYESRKSYLLVNGSSVGLIASILTSASRGSRILIARNCHKSIYNAVYLGGLEAEYLYPEIMEPDGITGEIRPEEVERVLEENPETVCVVIPSPNYYGICSDIAAISRVCHEHGAVLIVDQAHGAHLKFMNAEFSGAYPLSAEEGGADMVINSTHKTLASMTQTAVLNVMTDRADLPTLENYLQILESSSPSYPLMLSLDVNAEILSCDQGRAALKDWGAAVESFYQRAGEVPGLKVLDHPLLDRTKINFDMSAAGLNGSELEKELNKRGVWPELVTGNIVMCMTGIGTTQAHIDRLLEALGDIASASPERIAGDKPDQAVRTMFRLERKPIPERYCSKPLYECAGRISAGLIIPYPPGIPLACPGEVLTQELLEYVGELRSRGEKVIGVDPDMNIRVGI